ncbi:MAG: DEAD/DEAH box helicase family protein [Verrucomicrobiaceae bacterium]|nr:DEAD/DEAH box helicase family protein [Verrucomicrobiaceae bacterium]
MRCLPDGTLVKEGEWPRLVEEAWQKSDADACLALAISERDGAEGEMVGWLRDWGRAFMMRLCQVRNLTGMDKPPEGLSAEFVAKRPLIQGAEYLSDETMSRLWRDMVRCVEQTSAGDLERWLETVGAHWQGVGRLTLHLAENKQDPVRPFAFVATFAEKVSESGRLQHLPLARAVQHFQAKGDAAALDNLMRPLRASAERSDLIRRLLGSRQIFQALAWTPAEAYDLVKELALLRECGLVVRVPDWWTGGKPARPVVQVMLEPEQKSETGVGGMLSFRLGVSMNGELLTPEELEKIKQAGAGLVSLKGKWVEVNHEKLSQMMSHWQRVQRLHADGGVGFHEGMRWLAGFGSRGGVIDLQSSGLEQGMDWAEVVAGKELEKVLNDVRQPDEVSDPVGLNASLRPYQKRGVAWLSTMNRLGLGACLADDMGLGKTLQVIAFLLNLKEQGRRVRALVVCPASLIGNWRAECRKFAPDLQVCVAHHTAREQGENMSEADVVITTYLQVAKREDLQKRAWSLVILDEAQAIKNPSTTQTKAVKRLQARHRIALTGTPVENRPGDLWSLFDFLNPGLLGSAESFALHLKAVEGPRGVDYGPLRRLAGPYILRRMKTDKKIIQDLPEKIEVKERCYLTKKQAMLYGRLVEHLRTRLADPTADAMTRRGLVLGCLLKFKQICNHPSQFNGDGQFRTEDSGKFQRLTEICTELASRQERVLVFTQFQETCEPLAFCLREVFGREGLVLHGGTPVSRRAALVEQFQRSDGPPYFVISVKAGGTGLTLTAATQVIHFDRWWNPAVENQATDRAFRIGQKRNVVVHKFVVPGTIEERVDRLLESKRDLAENLIGDGGGELSLSEMSNDELLQMVALDIESASI